jgi:hypothetical protein
MIVASACEQCAAIAELRAYGKAAGARSQDGHLHRRRPANEPDTSRAVLEGLAPIADPALIEAFIALAQRS